MISAHSSKDFSTLALNLRVFCAIVRLLRGLPEHGYLKPILQIHDELTFLVPEEKVAKDFSTLALNLRVFCSPFGNRP